jgi:dynein heavy chain, axonemal
LPELEIAVKKVEAIDPGAFYSLKAIQKPSPSVVAVFKICCMFLLPNDKPPKQKGDKAESDPEGYWALSLEKFLNKPKDFLKMLVNYDRDNIPDALIKKVVPLVEQEVMTEHRIKGASQDLLPVRVWVKAMIKYYEVLKIVNPMRETARVMKEKLDVVMTALAEKQKMVREINAELDELNANGAALVAKAKALNDEIEDCNKKLVRAEKMIGGLEGEKVRWTDTVADLSKQKEMLIGDCLVAAGMVSYAGPFTADYREQLETMWRTNIKKFGIKVTQGVTMKKVLGNDVEIRQWGVAGLPSDNLSVENGIIMFGSRRWPLMIDPQTQANKFVKNMGKNHAEGLEVFKLSHPSLIRDLEFAIQFGKWVLLENIGETLDPALEPILLMQLIKTGSSYTIKVGDKNVPYNANFKFFMTTTLPNPHYSPETSVKVTILNFAITPAGLEEQMLNLFVMLEMPDLQEKKNMIVADNAKSAQIMYELEDKILATLSEAKEVMELLETDNLIDILADSKQTGDEINVRRAESEVTEKEIDVTRESFRSVAYRASLLFFCIVDLNIIDPMYQYSLQWFQRLFGSSVRDSQASEDVTERIAILNEY